LIGNDRFFGREAIYLDPVTGKDYPDQADRWIFFQQSAMEFIRTALPRVDIIHGHDHQAGLIPAYLRLSYDDAPGFARTRSVFTIHNIGYQGLFPRDVMARTGFSDSDFYPGGPFEFYGMVNFMKAAIVFADVVTTVSETYAQEIQESSELGFGLDGVLRSRSSPPVGILNGIDTDLWNPETDPYLPAGYNATSLKGKADNKRALLRRFSLPEARKTRPVLAMISRIEAQKGFDLVTSVLDDLLGDDLNFVLLGSGQRDTEVFLRNIVQQHPTQAAIRVGYEEELPHLIEAGADIFLMPSRYEPCGLNQMYSMRYGTVPVVHATGGLADTVQEFDPATKTGTGFTFRDHDTEQFKAAVHRAVSFWNTPRTWRKIMQNGMNADFSWSRSARRYMELYASSLL
jgi:starch synthase